MCGRFQFSAEESAELRQIIEEVQRNTRQEVRTGEIFPTNQAPVLTLDHGAVQPGLYRWGFPKFSGSGVVINARAETAADKPMFRRSLEERRCVVPTSGFFEWSHGSPRQKQKYLFRLPDAKELYLAGIYQTFQGIPCFTILTTAANDSIADVHDRMPVVVGRTLLHDWLCDLPAAMALLRSPQPQLERRAL